MNFYIHQIKQKEMDMNAQQIINEIREHETNWERILDILESDSALEAIGISCGFSVLDEALGIAWQHIPRVVWRGDSAYGGESWRVFNRGDGRLVIQSNLGSGWRSRRIISWREWDALCEKWGLDERFSANIVARYAQGWI